MSFQRVPLLASEPRQNVLRQPPLQVAADAFNISLSVFLRSEKLRCIVFGDAVFGVCLRLTIAKVGIFGVRRVE